MATGGIEYDKKALLGEGSFGTVYKGKFNNEIVAVKVTAIGAKGDKEAVAEMKVLELTGKSPHKNILHCYCVQPESECVLIALEMCQANLKQWVKSKGQCISPATTSHLKICSETVAGMKYLHDQSILHRDLKPENVLLCIQSESNVLVKVADFGLAKIIPDSRSSLTMTAPAGTQGWAAPEIIRYLEDKELKGGISEHPLKMTKAMDIFSLGCTLHYVLTDGKHPFGSTHLIRQGSILTNSPNWEELKRSSFPKALFPIRLMVEAEPSQRLTIEEVCVAFCEEECNVDEVTYDKLNNCLCHHLMYYLDNMNRQNTRPIGDVSQFDACHHTCTEMVQKRFKELEKPQNKKLCEEYMQTLHESLKNLYVKLRCRFESEVQKNLDNVNVMILQYVSQYEEELKRRVKDDCDERELRSFHFKLQRGILENFLSDISAVMNIPYTKDLVPRLNQLLQAAYNRQVNECNMPNRKPEEKFQRAVHHAFQLYSREMNRIVEDANIKGALFSPDQLEPLHALFARKSLEVFEESTANIPNMSVATFQRFLQELQNRMNEMFQDIERISKEADQLAYTNAEILASSCFNEYKDKMDESMFCMSNSEELARRHNFLRMEICKRFTSQCSVKDANFVTNHIFTLQGKVEQAFRSLGNDFKNVKVNEELLKQKTVFEAQQYYNSAMANIFGTARNRNKPIDSKDLHDIHLKQSEAAIQHAESQNPGLTEGQRRKVEQELVVHYQKYKEVNDMLMGSEDDPAIGIDLGTTYCCVAVEYGGMVKIIPNNFGYNTTPSYVAFDEDGNVVRIGQSAKDNTFRDPETTIFDAKRIIGRKMNDEQLQNGMKHWRFKLVEAAGMPAIKIGDRTFLPEQILASLLKHLKEMAEQFLNKQVKKAVITVPAYFNDGQRLATAEAGRIADLKVLSILNEPTAAGIAYKQQHFNDDAKMVLIFYFCDSTFDVALLDVSGNSKKILAVDGDTNLGGKDITMNMVKHCAKEFGKDTGIDLFEGRDSITKKKRDQCRQRLQRLRTHCEKSKKDLITATSTEVILDCIIQGEDLSVRITRKQFEDMNAALFEKSIQIVDRVLREAGVSIGKIDDVVLVGGSTEIRRLRQMLTDHFGGHAPFSAINPHEAVAYGAAVQAAILNRKDACKKLKLGEERGVMPISIKIEVDTKQMGMTIPKNTPIPIEFRDEYKTSYDNQDAMQIRVLHGENGTATANKLLGEFTLNGIPPGPKGEETIEVVMYIDAMAILHLTATNKSSMHEKKLLLTLRKD